MSKSIEMYKSLARLIGKAQKEIINFMVKNELRCVNFRNGEKYCWGFTRPTLKTLDSPERVGVSKVRLTYSHGLQFIGNDGKAVSGSVDVSGLIYILGQMEYLKSKNLPHSVAKNILVNELR